jgi:hypothetical protein
MRNGARKSFAWLVFSILITTCRAQSVPGPTCGSQFDFQPWREDFGQLTAEMAAHYANLESSQRERHMDLPKLRQETETKLRGFGRGELQTLKPLGIGNFRVTK